MEKELKDQPSPPIDITANAPKRYACMLVIRESTTNKEMMLVRISEGNRFQMEALAKTLHDNPAVAVAKGMHLFGASIKALYPTLDLASSYDVVGV